MELPKKYQAKIKQNTALNYCINKIVLELSEEQGLNFTPGQFLFYEIDDKVKRAYSIASLPQSRLIELFIDLRPGGPASKYFGQVKEGTSCSFLAPYGMFGLKETPTEKIFFAGSTGVAPFRSMLLNEANMTNMTNMCLYFGVHKEEEFFLLDELSDLEKKLPNFRFIPVVGDPGPSWKGEKGHVFEPYLRTQKNFSGKEFYICGSHKMVFAAKEELLKLGVDQGLIYNEKY